MADGIITREEEERLRAFRDRLALENSAADPGSLAELARAGIDRVMLEARLAAISVQDGDGDLRDLTPSIRQAGLGHEEANRVLIRAWETAAQGALEDGLLSLDEENALAKYADHFSLTQQDLDQNGVQTSLVQAAVLRDDALGDVPQRQRVSGHVPFNLMKSEQLVWVIQGVDSLETVVRRERRGSSQCLSIRVARGLYYRPSTFRSRSMAWPTTLLSSPSSPTLWWMTMMSRSDCSSQPPRAREPKRMAPSTAASATRSRQRAMRSGRDLRG